MKAGVARMAKISTAVLCLLLVAGVAGARDDIVADSVAAAELTEPGPLLEEIQDLDDTLIRTSRNFDRLREEQDELTRERDALAAELEGLEQRRVGAKRLAGIYRRGRLGSMGSLLGMASANDPLRMARYLVAVSRADNGALHDYEQARDGYLEGLSRLEQAGQQLQGRVGAARAVMDENGGARAKKIVLLRGLEKRLDERSLAESAGSSGGQSGTASGAREREGAMERILKRDRGGSSGHRSSLRGRTGLRSFSRRQGQLEVPMTGKLLRVFGQEGRRPGTTSQGLDVLAASDRGVKSVARGEIVFAGPFPGMGNTVIISHGDRFHTVYARLAALDREVGDVVSAGQQVGSVSALTRTLHFELRREGQTTDPLNWFARGGGAFTP